MGIQYVMCDSKHQRHHLEEEAGTSKMSINLNHPIENPASVELISFSTANELFNVKFDNNTFAIFLYHLRPASTSSVVVKNYTIQPGLYTIQELVEEMNAQITATPLLGTPGTPTVTVSFELLPSNKVRLNTGSSSSQTRRLILYSHNENFHNSIFHRIGFNRNQIFQSTNVLAQRDFYELTANVIHLFTAADPVLIEGIDEALWKANPNKALFWVTNQNEAFSGKNIGFEAYQHLLLKSDLISGDVQKVYNDNRGVQHTITDNILEKIDMQVSFANFLHFEKSNPMVHKLSGKTINSFNIELTDDNGLHFGTHEAKTFTCILKFRTTEILENSKVNEINNRANQKLAFIARHNGSI